MSLKIPSRFGFYCVLTNPVKGYEYMTKLLTDMEFPFVQLRIKELPTEKVEMIALEMRKITDGSKTRLIINDDPHIARKTGADGVHIGQNDMSYGQVREIVGEESIIGISTHSPLQTMEACSLKPDYIGIGPVFPTPTKKIPDPVIGVEGMKKMLSVATVPAVCIGGIDLSNLREVLGAGAQNFCMVRQLTSSDDPRGILGEMEFIYREFVSIRS